MYNNYNPYVIPRYAQPMIDQQTFINRATIAGKIVDSIDAVRAADISFDGNINYFPLSDGTAIITKQILNDGTSRITVFKPIIEKKEEIKYVTKDEVLDIINSVIKKDKKGDKNDSKSDD